MSLLLLPVEPAAALGAVTPNAGSTIALCVVFFVSLAYGVHAIRKAAKKERSRAVDRDRALAVLAEIASREAVEEAERRRTAPVVADVVGEPSAAQVAAVAVDDTEGVLVGADDVQVDEFVESPLTVEEELAAFFGDSGTSIPPQIDKRDTSK